VSDFQRGPGNCMDGIDCSEEIAQRILVYSFPMLVARRCLSHSRIFED
jgi:hypothetical protein